MLSRRLCRALAPAALAGSILAGASAALLGTCGPFTDVAGDAFCPFVLEIFYLGITTGTTPTTYDPASNVSRLQMAAFLSRTVDGALLRGSRRAALGEFWTPPNLDALGLTPVGAHPVFLKSDGADVWVANMDGGSVSRVRASDGKLLETWTGAVSAAGVLVAMGRILVTGYASPGKLYMIDPTQPSGAVTTVASNQGVNPVGIAFDGARVWTANQGDPGSVAIVTPGATIPWAVTTVTTGFLSPFGALYDGANVWVTDSMAGTLLKLDSGGAILQTVTVGDGPQFPAFDGTNIWVPNFFSNSVSVVRASNGTVLQTLTALGFGNPRAAAFDGQRVLVTSTIFGGNGVWLWKAANLTKLFDIPTGPSTLPFGACSDGMNFWITLNLQDKLARF